MENKKPSFLTSALSLMAFISLISVVVFSIMQIDVSDFAKQVISGIIGAYIGARIPLSPDKKEDANSATDSGLQD